MKTTARAAYQLLDGKNQDDYTKAEVAACHMHQGNCQAALDLLRDSPGLMKTPEGKLLMCNALFGVGRPHLALEMCDWTPEHDFQSLVDAMAHTENRTFHIPGEVVGVGTTLQRLHEEDATYDLSVALADHLLVEGGAQRAYDIMILLMSGFSRTVLVAIVTPN